MSRITPFLWFNHEAEEAAHFYAAVFRNSRIGSVVRYDEASARASGCPAGSVMTATLELEGQEFVLLNGGRTVPFNESVSFVITCGNQQELDHYWDRLSEGGDPRAQQCGWLKDRFGLSWQIVPDFLPRLLRNQDPRKSARVMKALLGMKKIILAELVRASEQE
ncbi:MAG TPA: VOC family protein [Chitinophagaceae bacterium]|nr:VOC family protein [Chitinophagaceae bacterium]